MTTVNLNLARKWRSKNFDQIVGQDLPIRMLKNSLYLGQYFPVYLFSGQRGCGKTSSARVFAAAVNCALLSDFQANPKNHSLPCLTCPSCEAMVHGKHPDFIEIDAASHTGVDNMRQLIDAASLLPLMGRKKIYLIDEAHMLSKAAFNALLKILEEPPSSVLFILATTNGEKIIDTVRSRCFQLFFKPVSAPNLLEHLTHVCQAEHIKFDKAGLALIIKETEGSVRDALNLIEQVRFSSSGVNKETVLAVLGHLDDERLLTLYELILYKGPRDLLKFLQAIKFETYSAEYMWRKLIELTRAALWIKHGVVPHFFSEYEATLQRLVKDCSIDQLHEVLDIFYSNESLFLKTTAQHALLEMLLLQICQRNDADNSSGAPSTPASPTLEEDVVIQDSDEYENDDSDEDEEEDDEEDDSEQDALLMAWHAFVHEVETLEDPLLTSVFKQGNYIQFDRAASHLAIEFSKELIFFQDWLNETTHLWQPILKKLFGEAVVFMPRFSGKSIKHEEPKRAKNIENQVGGNSKPVAIKAVQPPKKVQQFSPKSANQGFSHAGIKKNVSTKWPQEPVLTISDATIWKKATMLVRYFPGTLTEIRE